MKRYIILIILLILLIVGFIAFNKAFGKKDNSVNNISLKPSKYASYQSGDIVSFNDEDWYVLYDSSNKDNYVTLIYKGVMYLGDEELTLHTYKTYEASDLNSYLKNEYVKNIGEDKFREVNGYKVRLFNEDDMKKLLNVKYNENDDSYEISNCPEFICLTNSFYATMIPTREGEYDVDDISNIEDFNTDEYRIHLYYYNLSTTYETFDLESIVEDASLFVRPVINVYKESLDSNEKEEKS